MPFAICRLDNHSEIECIAIKLHATGRSLPLSFQNPFKMHASLAGENVIVLQEENGCVREGGLAESGVLLASPWCAVWPVHVGFTDGLTRSTAVSLLVSLSIQKLCQCPGPHLQHSSPTGAPGSGEAAVGGVIPAVDCRRQCRVWGMSIWHRATIEWI